MVRYVCGYAFDLKEKYIVLIEKKRPASQKGKLNGIGGKINDDESDEEAMIREFDEETGVIIINWTKFLILKGKDYEVVFYRAISDSVLDVNTRTDEEVFLLQLTDLIHWSLLDNTQIFINLALEKTELIKLEKK